MERNPTYSIERIPTKNRAAVQCVAEKVWFMRKMAVKIRTFTRNLGFVLATLAILGTSSSVAAEDPPSIVVITIDALRADRLGCYGYGRETSPNIDALIDSGVRFERAWTPEPLTGPAMCSMVTGLPPHRHAATRNGLRMQAGLDSLPKILARNGWNTAGFVGTWTLKDNLTLLGEHFETFGERLERKRWFGILNSEATCEDVTEDALDWVGTPSRPRLVNPFSCGSTISSRTHPIGFTTNLPSG